MANGSVAADVESAAAGREVTLTVTPDSGYKLKELLVVTTPGGENVEVTGNKFIMPASNVTVSAIFEETGGELVEETGTIIFGNNNVKINGTNVSGTDNLGNTWNITTEGTTSFTGQSGYYQVGSSKSPAKSITFKTTLSSSVAVKKITAKFGGFSGTAGNITLQVGDVTVGTGNLSATADVEVESTSSEQGQEITITITDIAKGVKCYNITYTYEK